MNSTLWTFALLHPWASNRIEYKRMPWRYTSLYWVWSSRRSETAFVTGELKIQNLMKITYSFYLIFDFARGLLTPTCFLRWPCITFSLRLFQLHNGVSVQWGVLWRGVKWRHRPNSSWLQIVLLTHFVL